MCPNRSLIQGIQEGQGMTKSRFVRTSLADAPTSVYTLVAARSLTHSLPHGEVKKGAFTPSTDCDCTHWCAFLRSFCPNREGDSPSLRRSLGAVWSHKSHSGLPPSLLPPSSLLPWGAARRGGGSKERQMRRWGLERERERDGERERLWPPGPPPDMTSILTAEDYLGWMGREKNNLGSFACVAG